MTAKVLDGEALAARIRSEVTDRVARLRVLPASMWAWGPSWSATTGPAPGTWP